MRKKKHIIAMCLVFIVTVMMLAAPASALVIDFETIQPRESLYLSSYGAYVYLPGDGLVQVWFDVQGTGTMDELGVLSIKIYESTDKTNWTRVITYTHDGTSGLLGYNDYYHSGHVQYQGVEGRYYKAYLCVWGGKGGKGDTRYFWTVPQPD